MKVNGKWQVVLVAGVLAMMVSPVLARENGNNTTQFLPQVMEQGKITYTTGGYGLNERLALEATAKKYDLIISNADKKGEFTANTKIVITNKDNHQMLTVNDAGPLFYAKLPPGTYLLKAANGEKKVERKISIVGKKQDKIYLVWPS